MNRTTYEVFLSVRELWLYFPHWRLGKLLDNLAIWSDGPNVDGIQAVSNDALYDAAMRQIEIRVSQAVEPQALTLGQQQTILDLEKHSLAHDEQSLGILIWRLAQANSKRVYDLEDADWKTQTRIGGQLLQGSAS